MSEFYCPYWDRPLSEVTEPEQEHCFAIGMSCANCMEDAEEEDNVE